MEKIIREYDVITDSYKEIEGEDNSYDMVSLNELYKLKKSKMGEIEKIDKEIEKLQSKKSEMNGKKKRAQSMIEVYFIMIIVGAIVVIVTQILLHDEEIINSPHYSTYRCRDCDPVTSLYSIFIFGAIVLGCGIFLAIEVLLNRDNEQARNATKKLRYTTYDDKINLVDLDIEKLKQKSEEKSMEQDKIQKALDRKYNTE